MPIVRTWAVVPVAILASLPAPGRSAEPAGSPPVPNVAELVAMRRLQAVQIAPDGSKVAFVVEEANDAEHSKDPTPTGLWVVPADGGPPRPYTRPPERASAPQWSPDGRAIAYLSGSQIRLVNADGGASRPLNPPQVPAGGFSWSPDGKRIAFLGPPPAPGDATARARAARGDDAIEVGPSDVVPRPGATALWTVDVGTGRVAPVPVSGLHVMAVQWSPGGDRLLVTAAANTTADEQQLRPRLVVVRPEGGTPTTFVPTRGKLLRPSWAPDGRAVAFLGSLAKGSDFYPNALYVCPGQGQPARDIVAGSPFAVESFCWAGDGRLLATVMQGTHRSLATIDVTDGKIAPRTAAPWEVSWRSDFSISRAAGRIACVLAQPAVPPDVWLIEPDGRQRQLTHLNPELGRRRFAAGEEVRWKAPDGWEITGVLLKPVGYRPGRRYPLVVHLHGSNVGDANDFHVSPSHWGQLLATRGYAVLMVNYRGSLTGSSAFRRGARGDFGGKDLHDILAGVDHLVQAGIADPDRLGISGVSYGGYLTARAVTQTTRFKAAAMASGISNWFNIHTGQTGAPECAARLEWDRSPFDAVALLWDRSPIAHIRDVRTPTLIFWGEFDGAIPLSHAQELYRGLRHYGVPAQLIVYPREGHVFRETSHLRDYYGRILSWFGKWLGPSADRVGGK